MITHKFIGSAFYASGSMIMFFYFVRHWNSADKIKTHPEAACQAEQQPDEARNAHIYTKVFRKTATNTFNHFPSFILQISFFILATFLIIVLPDKLEVV